MDAFIGAVLPTIEGDLPGTEGYKSAVGMILDLTMRVLLQHTLSPRDTTSEIQKKLADALRSIEDEALRANLYRATHSGHASEVKMLLERGADPNARNQMGVPALHSAAMGGHAAVVEMLLGRGAAVDPRTPDGATPLLGAVLEGHADVVRLLLRAGADPNAALPDGASALYFAAYARAPPIAKLLLAAGAKARAADENGHTPLHEAAFQGNAETVELLLKAGADANAKGRDGNTPLHLAACGSGDLAVVRSLLAHGAVADVREFEHGLTPRDCAAAKGYRDVVAILNQASRTRPSDNGA
jgi:cytohesin